MPVIVERDGRSLQAESFLHGGKKVFESLIKKSNPTANISYLTKGLYMLQMEYGNTVKTIKVLKN